MALWAGHWLFGAFCVQLFVPFNLEISRWTLKPPQTENTDFGMLKFMIHVWNTNSNVDMLALMS